MKLFFILGNQLFPPKYLDRFKNDHLFFMSEDHELCTYEKHHKLKILLFLSSMRSHADHLKKNKFKVEYTNIETTDFKKDYLDKVNKVIKSKKIKEITSFEIEDKFFEKKIDENGFTNISPIEDSSNTINSENDTSNIIISKKRIRICRYIKTPRYHSR